MVQTAVLFDNDGVLVDSEILFFRASREILAEIGLDLSLEIYRQITLVEGGSSIELANQKGLDRQAIEALRQKRNRVYEHLLVSEMRICDGVEETLHTLHGRVRMGVVSSTSRSHFDLIHAQTGLRRYFDFVLTRENYERLKPIGSLFDGSAALWSGFRFLLGGRGYRARLKSAQAAGLPCLVVPTDLNADPLSAAPIAFCRPFVKSCQSFCRRNKVHTTKGYPWKSGDSVDPI
jgi:phosphoserine phosphatase